MKIAIGSKNPSKILAVKNVFSFYFNPIEIEKINVPSGVPDQPLSFNDMYKGALNRAQSAIQIIKDADYGVGIEGGINQLSYGWFKSAIVVITNKNGEIGIGSSGGVILPEKIMSLIKNGETLSDAVDSIFNTKNIGKGDGIFGVLTRNYIDRSTATEHGVALALSRFLHPNLWR